MEDVDGEGEEESGRLFIKPYKRLINYRSVS